MWLFARVHVFEVCEPKDPRWAKEMFIRNAEWADHKTVVVRARLAAKFDITDRVSKIMAPTLIMMGGADRFTGEGSQLLHKMLPNSKIVEIPDVGHLLHMIKPELFVEAVEKHFESS
jgi:pimeloyl-ACP methyl ester carboxylesterase